MINLVKIAGILLCFLLSACGGKGSVMRNPQYVDAVSPSVVRIEKLLINNEVWVEDLIDDTVGFGKPKPQLAGMDAIGFGYHEQVGQIEKSISIFLNPPDSPEEEFTIHAVDIYVDDLTTEYPSADEVYQTSVRKDCPRGNGAPLEKSQFIQIPIIPRDDVVLEQREKYLKLKGTFDIPPTEIPRHPYLTCTSADPELRPNPEPPVILEVRGIHLDIDTELIFKWCGKGGDCYEI